jgi:hypothetical protein
MSDTLDGLTRQIRRTERRQRMQESAPVSTTWRLQTTLAWPAPQGASLLRHYWDGQRLVVVGIDAEYALTNNNLDCADWGATARGAPYIDFDGAAEYLSRAQGTFSDASCAASGVAWWGWFNPDAYGATEHIWGVWSGAGNDQWRFLLITGADDFRVMYSHDGTNINNLDWVTSAGGTLPDTGTWIFAGQYVITPTVANGHRGYWGTPDMVALETATQVSATAVFTGGAVQFTIGARDGPAQYYDGKVGILCMREGLALADADDYFARMFHLTRWFYAA